MTNNSVIYTTEDYSIFKRFRGNHEIKAPQVAKLIKSISEFGYIPVPIVVNER